MNIEEAINKIKEVIYMSDGTKVDYIDINHSDLGGEVSVDIFIKAIETLLTAYEKEKEKNKELTSALLDSTPDDKIKAKIEEIDIEIQVCEYADDDTEEYKQDIEKEKRRLLRDKAVLQSLLEKE